MTNYYIKYVFILLGITALFYWGLNRGKVKQPLIKNSGNKYVADQYRSNTSKKIIKQRKGDQFKINGVPAFLAHYTTKKSINNVFNEIERKSGVSKNQIITQQLGDFTSLGWFDVKNGLYNCYLIRQQKSNVVEVYPATLNFKKAKKHSYKSRLKDLPDFPKKPLDFHVETNDFDRSSDSFIHIVNGYPNSAVNFYTGKMLSFGWKQKTLTAPKPGYIKNKILFFSKGARECTMCFRQIPQKAETLIYYTVVQK